nr:unnamed protein product [Spirometra erinaceieuropaei]
MSADGGLDGGQQPTPSTAIVKDAFSYNSISRRRMDTALKEEFYRNSRIAVSRTSSNPTASAAGLAEVDAKRTVKQPTGSHGNSLPTSPASPSHQPLFQSRLGRANQFVDCSS